MKQKEIQLKLFEVLEEVKILCGFEWDKKIDLNIVPLKDLNGFDSLCSVEATVIIEEKLGIGELGVNSFFLSDKGSALTIAESSKLIESLIQKKGKK